MGCSLNIGSHGPKPESNEQIELICNDKLFISVDILCLLYNYNDKLEKSLRFFKFLISFIENSLNRLSHIS